MQKYFLRIILSSFAPNLSPEGMIMPEEVADAVAFLIEHRGNAIIDEMRLHRLGKEPF